MIEIKGEYTSAIIYTDNVESEALSQIYGICSHPIFKDNPIRIQADTHAGKGCVIGFTARLNDNKIIPNLIGVDIGCAMTVVKLGKVDLDLVNLDKFILNNIPHGNNVSKKPHKLDNNFKDDIYNVCKRIKDVDSYDRHIKSIGSLGSGNHFIEVSKDKEDNIYLIIHSGSRNFGHKIATFYQKRAELHCDERRKYFNDLINSYRIKNKIEKDEYTDSIDKENIYKVPKDLSFLEGEEALNYLNDMKVAQKFASANRKAIAKSILNYLSLEPESIFETIHNYISDDGYIRKGAISAKEDEIVLIPINMRDGSILARGKGNEEYNYSAPHGAGRIMSRSKAKSALSLEDFKNSMDGIYTTSVGNNTLDEAPMAYKPIKEILNNIGDTVEVLDILKPIYNFKSN